MKINFYDNDSIGKVVRFNGEKVSCCIEADDIEGYIKIMEYDVDSSKRPPANVTNLREITKYGKVVIIDLMQFCIKETVTQKDIDDYIQAKVEEANK